MAGTSSPSANSRMMVPETGEVLSSSKANFRDAFLLAGILILAFLLLLGEAFLGDEEGGLFSAKLGLRGGEPRPISLTDKSTPGGADLGKLSKPWLFEDEEEAAMAATRPKNVC